jgi:uncharacterized membrane protein YedE/YeeE
MESASFWDLLKQEIRKTYTAIFQQTWPSWLGGVLLAIIALMMFLWENPWGIAGGYRNWGDWFYYLVGIKGSQPELSPWLHPLSVSNIGLLIGALASALLGGQFQIRRAPAREYIKGLVGGILMGSGAALASGCNVGGFYTAISMYSMGGFAMMFGLGVGAYLGLRLLILEMNHLPQAKPHQVSPSEVHKVKKIEWAKVQPYIGGLILLAGIIAFYVYAAFEKTPIGGLLFFGLLIGIVMHRSRFCFVRAFRDPYMTGESDMVRAVAISLMIYGLGSAVIKWSFIQPDTMGVYHPFWLGSMLGGLIFGVGMLLAGGCASGTLWRVGEGHTKLMVALVAFSLINSASLAVLRRVDLSSKLGEGIFIPKVFTWEFTLPLFVAFLLFWSFMAIWNEKTEKFVVF